VDSQNPRGIETVGFLHPEVRYFSAVILRSLFDAAWGPAFSARWRHHRNEVQTQSPSLWEDATVYEPVIDDVEPAEEGMDQSPQDTMVDFPAQQSRKDGADAAEDATAATPAAFLLVSSHRVSP
jgi:hypothetical protein